MSSLDRRRRRILVAAMGGSQIITLTSDPFTAADATDVNGRVPPITVGGAAWAATAGSWSVSSNRALAGAAVSTVVIETGDADVTITCDMIMGDCTATNNMQLLVRASDALNGWLINLTKASNLFSIDEWVAGSNTTKASTTFNLANNQVVALRVTLSGQTITATADGANQISYNSAASNLTVTKHGVRAVQTGTITTRGRFDNFVVMSA